MDHILLTYTAPGGVAKEVKVKTMETPASTAGSAAAGTSAVGTAAAAATGEKSYWFLMPEINQDGIEENAKVTMEVVMIDRAPAAAPSVVANAAAAANSAAPGTSVGIGASFAINSVNKDQDARTASFIGTYRTVETGTISMVALLQNDLRTSAAAGADPLANRSEDGSPSEDPMDIALDAAVAVGKIDNKVYTYIAEGASVTANKSDLDIGSFDEEEYLASLPGEYTEEEKQAALEQARSQAQDLVSVYLSAQQEGHTLATAGSFAIGASAAVGACAAVNYANSDVCAQIQGTVTAPGKARILSQTYNTDDAFATATAMGADIQRYLDRLGAAETTAEKIANGD